MNEIIPVVSLIILLQMINLIKRHIIPFLLCLFCFIGLFLWIFFGEKGLGGFGLNFFTEMLGVVITVLLIDYILKSRRTKEKIPKRIAAYRDISIYVNRYHQLWVDLYHNTVPDPTPSTIEEFFTNEVFRKIMEQLDLNSQYNIFPPMTWWKYMPYKANELHQLGNKILNRYSDFLQPDIFWAVHQLTESMHNQSLRNIEMSRSQLTASGKPPKRLIEMAWFIPPSEFPSVIRLYKWMEAEFEELKKQDPNLRFFPYNSNAVKPAVLKYRLKS